MKRRLSVPLALFLLGAMAPAEAGAREGPAEEAVLSTTGLLSSDVLPAGSRAEAAFQVKLNGSWHVNAHVPSDPLLIPTKLTLDPVAGLTLGEPVFTDPVKKKFEFSDDPLLVYAGSFTVRVPINADAGLAPGVKELRGKLRYQACDDERCLAPREEVVSIAVTVAAAGAQALPTHPEVFAAPAGGATAATATATATATPAASVTPGPNVPGVKSAGSEPPPSGWLERFARYVAETVAGGSYGLGALLLFLIGLVASFTPCIYPVIPITVSYFANQSERRGGKTFSLALVYVLAMATMYAALGAMAGLSSKAFGSALASPYVLVFVAAVMVALALSMFGLWEFGIPGFLATRLGASPAGYGGAVFMGLTVGVVAAPCIGPVIVMLLGLVTMLKSAVLGMAVFFVFALGLGFPFLVLGSASGAISRLPRSGEWMVWIKHFFGVIMLCMAAFFLRALTGDIVFLIAIGIVGLGGGIFLAFLDPAGRSSAGFRRVRAVVGVLIAALSLGALGLGALSSRGPSKEQRIAWRSYEEAAFAKALGSGRPVLVDFTAEWCIPCKELEHLTFSDERVGRAASRFAAFRADGTVEGDPVVSALRNKFGVKGYPTILLIDSKGAERADLRVVGFVNPEDFEGRLQRVD